MLKYEQISDNLNCIDSLISKNPWQFLSNMYIRITVLIHKIFSEYIGRSTWKKSNMNQKGQRKIS